MIGLYYILTIVLISIICGEIRYRYLQKSQKNNAFVIDKNWENSIDREFRNLEFNDSDIKEAISCEMTQMLH